MQKVIHQKNLLITYYFWTVTMIIDINNDIFLLHSFTFSGVTKNLMMKNHVSIEGVLHQALQKMKRVNQIAIYPSSR